MAKNRRDSTSVTFAIGQGCFLLLLGAVCVGISVTKVIVGSEYVNKCPSREMIPIYVLVSGCLPVLLSALRQPYNAGHVMDKERCSMKISLVIAIVGVMVNLAWLVAGTYLVVTTWRGTICNTPIHKKVVGTTSLEYIVTTTATDRAEALELVNDQSNTLQTSSQLIKEIGTYNHVDVNFTVDSLRNLSSEDKSRQHTTLAEKEIMGNAKSKNVTNIEKKTLNTEPLADMATATDTLGTFTTGSSATEEDDIESDVIDSKSIDSENDHEIENNEGVNNTMTEVSTNDADDEFDDGVSETFTQFPIGHIVKESTKDVVQSGNILIKPEIENVFNEIKSGFTEATSQEDSCITCDKDILRFSLAVVIIDWMFVLIGVVYFCHFVYHRFASLKDQLLLINA